MTVSQYGKIYGGMLGSISGQIATLRARFRAVVCNESVAAAAVSSPLCSVLNGSIPLVANAHNADAISAILRYAPFFFIFMQT